ncbi:PEP-CTERM sorting domain-containing protein [Methylotenera sp. N17]|uniref:PEP-CTERM sorting domain-containing protein n=1 Tax=Methylotenera sp. N17 TaxID=1502761 RepID=UPI0006477DFC|nr:PEP-CTERM sorting domain-containing protein [Methylotenera sp. N17]
MALIKLLTASLGVYLALSSSVYANTTFNLAAYPLSGTNHFTATLTTNLTGSFTDELEIENILNSSSYIATLFNASEPVTYMDNSNSVWDLMTAGADATLTIDASQMTLSFATLNEYTSGVLLLRSADFRSTLQYRQENNVTDYNFVDYSFDALVSANSPIEYQSAFTLPAITTVPAPSSALLLLSGLGLIGIRSKTMKR